MVAWTSNFTAEPKSYSFGNFHSLFHPPPSVLSSSLFFFSSQIYLHLLPPPNLSSHTYRRVQYVTWQQQSKYSPAYVLFKARTTSFTTSVKCTFSPGLTLHYQLLALMAVWGIQWCNSLKTKHEQPWKGVRAGKQIFFTIWSPHIYPTSSTAASPHLIYISALARSFPLYGSVVCHTFPHPSTAPFPWWRGKEQVSLASVPFG